jgi:lipopolysaccharide export LptBFGC system permease protein LptF
MDENKLNIMLDIGNLQYLIFKKNKKLHSRIKVKKYLLHIKIYVLLRVLNQENTKWQFHNEPNIFIKKYLDDESFFKNNIIGIFHNNNLPESIKKELPINKNTIKGIKTLNYLIKNKIRITSSDNNYLDFHDFIRFYQALTEDEEELKLDIYNLTQNICDKLNSINELSIIPNLTHFIINQPHNTHNNIKSNLKKDNSPSNKEDKHVHFYS